MSLGAGQRSRLTLGTAMHSFARRRTHPGQGADGEGGSALLEPSMARSAPEPPGSSRTQVPLGNLATTRGGVTMEAAATAAQSPQHMQALAHANRIRPARAAPQRG